MGFTEPKNGRHNSYEVSHANKTQNKAKNKRKSGNLDDLKQELDIDYHKISVDEIFFRFHCHAETVSISKSRITIEYVQNWVTD